LKIVALLTVFWVTTALAIDPCNCKGYSGPGGPAYDSPGGPCYSGPGGPCYSGPGGTGENSPGVCR